MVTDPYWMCQMTPVSGKSIIHFPTSSLIESRDVLFSLTHCVQSACVWEGETCRGTAGQNLGPLIELCSKSTTTTAADQDGGVSVELCGGDLGLQELLSSEMRDTDKAGKGRGPYTSVSTLQIKPTSKTVLKAHQFSSG